MSRARPQRLVAGGGKGCFWGCLGLADCYEVACDFDAIHMNAHDAARSSTRRSARPAATASRPAPRTCSHYIAASHRLWVACKSLEAGDELLEDCRGRLHRAAAARWTRRA